ncbi:thioredoxin [Candidatus Gracilibacteria bacterium]|nr:thioredoxin [Candidatus Gracilibacteria bacterium]
MSEIIVTDANFEQEVLNSKGLTMVDFYADWCGPCKMLAPIVEKMADEFEGKIKICKLNVDNSPETSMKYGIQGIPTMIFFKDGQPVDSNTGFLSEENMRRRLSELLEG